MRLPRSFFEQKTLKVARQLLGCFLIRQVNQKKIITRIIETEAYCGPKDLANHASKGRTKRTEVMFGKAGHAYIYLIYGMYYCFNIVTEKEGCPAAVLIRSVELLGNQRHKDLKIKRLITGPGKVCRELKIDRSLNGLDLIISNQLYITDRLTERFNPLPLKIKKLPRVGVDYAGKYKNKLWRFILSNIE